MPDPIIKVVIPARNEVQAITKVIDAIPSTVSEIIIADNGSTDGTSKAAEAAGASTIYVETPGYGRACLAGIDAAGDYDIMVFLDGDASDYPEDIDDLIAPIISGEKDLMVGSRLNPKLEDGALTVQQRFGNRLACFLMTLFWKSTFTDLGPFRAITKDALESLNMEAPTFGWTVEMQVRALKQGLRYGEVPVRYRPRIGTSKISGTLSGVILAGYYILGTIFKEAVFSPKKNPATKAGH